MSRFLQYGGEEAWGTVAFPYHTSVCFCVNQVQNCVDLTQFDR
jgi:hypothetical protein